MAWFPTSTGPASHAWAGLAVSPVIAAVRPDEPTARRWLIEELSKAEYREAAPTAWDRLMNWLADLLANADGTPAPLAIGVLLTIVVVGVILVLLRIGPARGLRSSRPDSATVFQRSATTAADHRRHAAAAAEAGQWVEAVQESFRAIVRALQDRTVLDERPGLTAREATTEAAARFPTLADRLQAAGEEFDAVSFGNRAADRAGYHSLRDLDTALAGATPAAERRDGPMLAAPS